MCTCFNGASSIAQAGGLACLSPEGFQVKEEKRPISCFYVSMLISLFTEKNFILLANHGYTTFNYFLTKLKNFASGCAFYG